MVFKKALIPATKKTKGVIMSYDLMENNKVYLRGTITKEPEFSHEVFGEGFYELEMAVQRLSDHNDIIPITLSERLLDPKVFAVGNEVTISGQFRSYNKMVDEKSRLMLTVFVREVLENDYSVNPNIIELVGYLCKPPVYRTTPFKREICDLLLAVNRAYNKSDYLPCIAWGRNARFIKNANVGQKVFVSGRIQSREYQKKIDEEQSLTKTAYEISINRVSLNGSFDYNETNNGYNNLESENPVFDIADKN